MRRATCRARLSKYFKAYLRARPRTFSFAVAHENFSVLLARPVVLDRCTSSLSSPTSRSGNIKKRDALRLFSYFWATCGARTHDRLDHNQVLYQLS